MTALARHDSAPTETPRAAEGTAAIAVLDLRKRFGGVEALKGVSLDVRQGEILGLVGHNGAGKSTLVRMLQGDLAPDSGEIRLSGVPVRFASIANALEKGVGVVRQELELVPDLTIANNIYLGDEGAFVRGGVLNRQAMFSAARPLLRSVGLDVAPDMPLARLALGDQQLVAAARALRRAGRVLILDEPTSSLSPHEAQRLFAQVRDMAVSGKAIIYISHRLDEVAALCHRVIVLRDGAVAGSFSQPQTQIGAIVDCMSPGASAQLVRKARERGAALLDVQGLTCGRHGPANLTLRRGEIVGMFGLVGAGRTTIARSIVGDLAPTGGAVTLRGTSCRPASPADAFDAGIAYLSENRKKESIFVGRSLRDNIGVKTPGDTATGGLLRTRRLDALARDMIARLAIRTPGPGTLIEMLSGGNQQKAVLGRLIADKLEVLLLDEPTHGIDIAAKRDLLQALDVLAGQGKAILFISSELPELMQAADRILIIRQGRILADVVPGASSEREILGIAAGEGVPR